MSHEGEMPPSREERRHGGGLKRAQAVSALIVSAPGGIDTQTHLLFECAAEEAAHRVGLPAGSFAKFLERGAAGPPK